MVWTVTAGNVGYFKYARMGKVLLIKGAITGTSLSGTATSGLRRGGCGPDIWHERQLRDDRLQQ
jgi:hypothetical protein